MNKRLLIIAGALIALAISLFIASRFLFNEERAQQAINQAPANGQEVNISTEKPFPLSDALSAELITQAENEYNFAFGKAREWRDDCTPVAVVAKYTGSIDRANGKNTYIFISPSLAEYYFALTIDQAKNERGGNNFERILYFKEDYFLPNNTVVMPVKYWATSYIDILRQADSLGGKAIRNSDINYDVNLVLSAQEGKYLLWDVEYLVDGQKVFGVTIDAYEGKVQ